MALHRYIDVHMFCFMSLNKGMEDVFDQTVQYPSHVKRPISPLLALSTHPRLSTRAGI
jgi:hypothetical protein